MDGQA